MFNRLTKNLSETLIRIGIEMHNSLFIKTLCFEIYFVLLISGYSLIYRNFA